MVERLLIALPSQLQLIDRLQHLIYLSSSLIFIAGRKGAGKTVLMEQLSNHLPHATQEAFIHLNEPLPDAHIRQQIITQLFEHPLFDANDSLFSSFVQLQEKFNIDLPQVIIVDNTQYLSNQLLTELAQLVTLKAQVSDSEINVLLLGNDESNSKQLAYINEAMPNNEPNCTCLEFKIEPLSHEETIALLDHVFKQSDYQSQVQHQDAVSKKLNDCAGNPQKIIALAEEIIAGKLQNNEMSKLRARVPAFLFMCFLLLIVVAIAIHLKDKFFATEEIKAIDETVLETKLFVAEEIEATNLVTTNNHSESVATFAGEQLAGSWPSKFDTDLAENKLKVGISDDSVARVVISEQEIINSTEVNNELPREQQDPLLPIANGVKYVVVESPSDEQENANLSEPIEEDKHDIIDSSEISRSEERSTGSDTEVAAKIESLPIETKTIIVEKQHDPIFTSTEKLLSIPSSHFTLQLLAMDSKESLQRFIREHRLPKKNVFVYQTIHNNKPRYMIIYGEYTSIQLAQQASKNLPDSLAKMDSWIKKYRLVHQDLQRNND